MIIIIIIILYFIQIRHTDDFHLKGTRLVGIKTLEQSFFSRKCVNIVCLLLLWPGPVVDVRGQVPVRALDKKKLEFFFIKVNK